MTDQEFFNTLEAAGHSLVRGKYGQVDIWQCDADIHNGQDALNAAKHGACIAK